ncbi:SdpI/YhfL protein family [Corynebacterium camporealensis]|uniref:SdpI/YhfL protein family n=1 Tax=Corynebacterium camporealensis TaxID=161896 RepID=A0A0F6QXF4_9CORY|nr:SdpI family protein [Corynebacterium camporealensis]AKE38648.1 SdpI/YhfL protein family [Corynebacterium camporealensis]AVH87935.1 SdpI/YhfL protein family [Corynebacterium camporealensis]MDY5839499.1 SdpI family protein [Corynebacterium camporealensis]
MSTASIVLAVVWLLSGALVLWIGVKAAQGTLPKNELAGIRTAAVMRNEETWFKGHKAAADLLITSSVPMLIGGIASLFVANEIILCVISLAVAVLVLVITILACRKANAAVEGLQ